MNEKDYLEFVELVDEMREAQKNLDMHNKQDYEDYLDQWNEADRLESKVDKALRKFKNP